MDATSRVCVRETCGRLYIPAQPFQRYCSFACRRNRLNERGKVSTFAGEIRVSSKHCRKCDATRPIDEFRAYRYTTVAGRKSVRIATHCLECEKAQKLAYYQRRRAHLLQKAKDYRARNLDAVRERDRSQRRQWRRRLATYGLTVADYQRMHDEQDGRCAICRKPSTRLAVDHCHRTNRVRGLLCKPCNLAVGNVLENAETARALVEYVETRCVVAVAS